MWAPGITLPPLLRPELRQCPQGVSMVGGGIQEVGQGLLFPPSPSLNVLRAEAPPVLGVGPGASLPLLDKTRQFWKENKN